MSRRLWNSTDVLRVVLLACALVSGCGGNGGSMSVDAASAPFDAAVDAASAPFDAADRGDGGDIDGGPRETLQVSTSGEHACALRGGEVYCWGRNYAGQVDRHRGDVVPEPSRLAELPPATYVSMGSGGSCAALMNGTVRCWGLGFEGITEVANAVDMVELWGLAVSWCGRTSDGEVWCWGDLGRTGTADGWAEAYHVPLPGPAIDLHGSYFTACAVLDSGQVYCWDRGFSVTAVRVPDLEPAVQVAVGGIFDDRVREHVCVLGSDGVVRCSGDNNYGQLAQPSHVVRLGAVEIDGLSGVASIEATRTSTYAVLEDGTVRCWGGHCGRTVQSVDGVAGVVQLSWRGDSPCAVFADNVIRCWGSNDQGELGDGTFTDREHPTTVNLGHD